MMKKYYSGLLIICMWVMISTASSRTKRQIAWPVSDKPEGTECTFNPCSYNYSKFCLNNSTCILNETNCRHYCICANGFRGSRCDEDINATPTSPTVVVSTEGNVVTDVVTTTLRPLNERNCMPGFICVHGTCDRSQRIRCVCDLGWTGAFCNYKKQNCLCDDGTPCVTMNGGFSCPNKNKNTTKQIESTPQSSTTASHGDSPSDLKNITSVGNSTRNACSANYVMRPLQERYCLSNFICTYGICEMHTDPSKLRLRCLCDKGGYGGLCQETCCLNCSKHGICKKTNGTEFCHCYAGYDGKECEIRTPLPVIEDVDWYYYVIGICVAIMLLLIVALVILPYYMWRNRVPLIMKLVHYLQPYEDDDERIWDAFVSYKSCDKDEGFVLHTLLPKLEHELGFTLCLHFRDFTPGDTIANNIINAVNNSRRTILILTPRYVESEFTRFEYQVAQHEMLKRKHRILPILLEDISDQKNSMDPNLKHIIKSVTYLEYPGEDSEKKLKSFWTRMELSLPKKRSREERQSSDSRSSSTSSSTSTTSTTDSGFSNESISTIELDTYKSEKTSGLSSPNDVQLSFSDSKSNGVSTETDEYKNGDLHQNIDKYISMMETQKC